MLGFLEGAQATRADMHALETVAFLKRDGMHVGQPATLGMPLGVAHLTANLGSFSANITPYCHPRIPLSNVDEAALKPRHVTTGIAFVQVVRQLGEHP